MIELEDFRTVVAVVDSGGINKAAQLLHRVPSALSMRLQNLENRLGITLFEKQGRNIIPTAYALELAEDGRKILSSVRTAESASEFPAARFALRSSSAGSCSGISTGLSTG